MEQAIDILYGVFNVVYVTSLLMKAVFILIIGIFITIDNATWTKSLPQLLRVAIFLIKIWNCLSVRNLRLLMAESFKVYQKNNLYAENQFFSENQCLICLDVFSNCKTGCGHHYHAECLSEWTKHSKTCPIFRRKLN